MTLELVIPETEGKDRTTKDLVFTILSEGEEKTLTQLHREIKKIYRVSVSFQAVIKAVNSLLEHKVILKDNKQYTINKDWIFETRNFFDKLYTENFKVAKPLRKVEMGKEMTLYTLSNLFELDRLWNDLLTNWAKKEDQDKRNVWKGEHCWWLIPRLQEEDILHDLFEKKEIKTYNLITNNALLDKLSLKYYQDRREKAKISRNNKLKTKTQISAFGDFVIKFNIPENISKRLEKIYQKTKNLNNLDLKEVLDIFKQKTEIELTLIKDKFFADKLKEDIISYFR